MGAIAAAAEGYITPWTVVDIWLDSAQTSKRPAAIGRLDTAERLVDSLEKAPAAEDGSDKPLGNPELKRARQQVTRYRRELADIETAEREHAHRLRFEKVPGLVWSDIAATYPPRPTSQVDQRVETNYHAAGIHAAKVSGVRLVEDPEGTYEYQGRKWRGEPIDDDDWRVITTIGSGWDAERIAWANLELNVLHASTQLERLSKG